VHVSLVVDDELGHEPVPPSDAALGEVAGEAEVLAAAATCGAVPVIAWSTDHRDEQVAGVESRDARADLDDLAQRLVPDDEVVAAVGRRAVLERADLAIGAADDVEHAELHVGRVRDGGFVLLDQGDLSRGGSDGNGFHGRFDAAGARPVTRGAAGQGGPRGMIPA